jgi:hypothetical protein
MREDGQTDGETDGWTDGRTGRQADGQTGRQADVTKVIGTSRDFYKKD